MPEKPSEKEEEYFVRKEFERRKQVEEEIQKRLAAEEKERLRKLHHMKCPKCGMELLEMDYRNVKIDKCSACEGIWLDKGELEAVAEMDKSLASRLFRAFR